MYSFDINVFFCYTVLRCNNEIVEHLTGGREREFHDFVLQHQNEKFSESELVLKFLNKGG
jgi:hypothetical protein